jgi:hypothetical protein
MAGAMRITRSKGSLTGLALVLLGIWGAIVPFIAPYWGYGLAGPGSVSASSTWAFTLPRLYLDILPGAAVLLGGLILLGTHNRATATFGSSLAIAGGVWFVVGPQISRIWGAINQGTVNSAPVANTMGWYYGLGVIVTLLAAVALGRMLVRGVRDARRADLEHEPENPHEGRHIQAA